MKLAKVKQISSHIGTIFEITCPSCDMLVSVTPDGALWWGPKELVGKKTVRCFVCNEESRLPVWTRSRAGRF